jgi:DNA-directed RNA polymerase specialized sigma subunit
MQKIVFLPQAIQVPLNDEGEEVELSDENEQMDCLYSQINAETTLLYLLEQLSDREKIFLLYQVMSMFGMNISQERYAKTLGISRITYINKLSELKRKLFVFIKAN